MFLISLQTGLISLVHRLEIKYLKKKRKKIEHFLNWLISLFRSSSLKNQPMNLSQVCRFDIIYSDSPSIELNRMWDSMSSVFQNSHQFDESDPSFISAIKHIFDWYFELHPFGVGFYEIPLKCVFVVPPGDRFDWSNQASLFFSYF